MRAASLAQGSCALAILGVVYAGAVVSYAQDEHYRAHFAILWVFLAVALVRAARGPLWLSVGLRSRRDLLGHAAFALACLVLAVGVVTGSSTLQRVALAGTLLAGALFAVPAWGICRCLGFWAFVLLCFGVPFSAYFTITKQLAIGMPAWLAVGAPVLGYDVVGLSARFPHFRVDVIGSCTGFNQLVVFVAIAALGVLVAAPRPRRAAGLLALAVVLAWVANGVRLWLLLALVALGSTRCVTDDAWHAGLGLLVDLPFLGLLVWVVLRTHEPFSAAPVPRGAPRGAPIVVLALAQLALVQALGRAEPQPVERPAWVGSALAGGGASLVVAAPSEEREREIYATPWLVNGRFVAESGLAFELFAFETSSRRHLNVHSLANCLEAAGESYVAGPAVTIDGRTLFTFELAGPRGPRHGYYAFEIDCVARDDSWRSQLAALVARLRGGAGSVALVRVIFSGAAKALIPDEERTVLEWVCRLRVGSAAPR